MTLLKKTPQPAPRGGRTYRRTPLTTYYRSENTTPGHSPFQKKEPPKNRRKIVAGTADILLIIVLLAALIYSLLVSPSAKVTATDLAYHTAADYQAQVESSLTGFKNRNKITFDEQSIASQIQSKFPEVQAVQTELPVFSEQPNIKLIIAPPALKLSTATGDYVVDSQGVAVRRLNGPSDFSKLIGVTDQSGFRAQTGRQVLSSDAVSFITNLVNQCHHAGVAIKSLTLPALPQELDLRTSDQSYYVKLYLGGDVNLQVGQFFAARHQFAQTHQSPSDYLDVRVAGKVFYK